MINILNQSRPVSSQTSSSSPAITTTSRSCSLIRESNLIHTFNFCYSPKRLLKKLELKSSLEKEKKNTIEIQALRKHFVSGFATVLLLFQTQQGIALDLSKICLLGNVPLENTSNGKMETTSMMMMMRGMTAKNFDPVRYSGRWFEVASLKGGFAGAGQEDCHCTQGVYTFDMKESAIRVDTFCVHGNPNGYITGIRGKVQCISEEDLEKNETALEKQEMIKEKCYLRFPTIPFIPKEPYDVIATDYESFALVSGAKDKSFVQVYSRTPNPGSEFIEKHKNYLAQFGYDVKKIKDTPQDCEVMSDGELAAMMTMPGMEQTLTNQFPDLGLKKSVEFDPFTSVFGTFKKLVELYFK